MYCCICEEEKAIHRVIKKEKNHYLLAEWSPTQDDMFAEDWHEVII
jgi:hypothetical protein